MIKINRFLYKKQTIIEIGTFSILWNIFERECFKQKCTAEKIRKKLYSFQKIEEIKKEIDSLRIEICKYMSWGTRISKEEIFEAFYTDNKKIKKIDENVYEYLNKISQNLEDYLQGCLFICLRLRNNMFHGVKLNYFLDEQVNIFKKLNLLLTALLDRNIEE